MIKFELKLIKKIEKKINIDKNKKIIIINGRYNRYRQAQQL